MDLIMQSEGRSLPEPSENTSGTPAGAQKQEQ